MAEQTSEKLQNSEKMSLPYLTIQISSQMRHQLTKKKKNKTQDPPEINLNMKKLTHCLLIQGNQLQIFFQHIKGIITEEANCKQLIIQKQLLLQTEITIYF